MGTNIFNLWVGSWSFAIRSALCLHSPSLHGRVVQPLLADLTAPILASGVHHESLQLCCLLCGSSLQRAHFMVLALLFWFCLYHSPFWGSGTQLPTSTLVASLFAFLVSQLFQHLYIWSPVLNFSWTLGVFPIFPLSRLYWFNPFQQSNCE